MAAKGQDRKQDFELTIQAFEDGGEIPRKHTCEGEDTAPALAWRGAPEGTRTFALIVDDPDAPDPEAPERTFVHWVLFNIPAEVDSIQEGAGVNRAEIGIPEGALSGLNDYGETGYRGPCPPKGRHRYFFKLFALDTEIRGLTTPTAEELESAIEGHVLAKAERVGTYQATRRKTDELSPAP